MKNILYFTYNFSALLNTELFKKSHWEERFVVEIYRVPEIFRCSLGGD